MRKFLAQLGIGLSTLMLAAGLFAAPVGTAFTYQAQLKNAGAPFTGNADLTFRLYDAASGGTLLGAQTLSNQAVDDGLVTVTLNAGGEFSATAFDGGERWLEIEVNGVALTPRQPMTPAPYALGLRPGSRTSAAVDAGPTIAAVNSSSSPNSSALYGQVTTTTGYAFGVWGENASSLGSGVWGNASSSTGNTIGVLGTANSTVGSGISAFALSSTGTNYALRASTFSPDGYAGYFTGGRNYFEGRVGVGAANPQAILHVAAVANPDIRLQDTSSGGKTFHMGIATADGSFRIAESGIADRIIISSAGNIGINNANPIAPLSFPNNLGNKIAMYGTSTNSLYGFGIQGNLLQIYADTAASDVAIGYGGSATFTEAMRVKGNGRVGIGTTNPGQKLSVNGVIESVIGGFKFPDGTTQTTAAGNGFWVDAGGNNIVNSNTSNVGIGNSTPQFKFDVLGVDNAARFDGTSTFGTTLSISNRSVAGGLNYSLIATGSGNSAGSRKFMIRDVGNGSDRFVIDASGNVGIGTTAPAAKLDVIGTTRTQVLQITGGSDIAEPYNVHSGYETTAAPNTPSAEQDASTQLEVEPGMVVSIDPNHVGELRIAGRAYDSTVAGIVSGANGVNVGLTLTQAGSVADGKHPIAMTGRVWCFVDADANGAIQAGDLLTTSDTPGHAMKATDRERMTGAVIGKAMSSLDSGRGLVLVLVNLQ